ncbi:MAG: penicillin acylase family protein [Anaerolineales bacterium]|nr:penicillin acylase family protein [Anaerolineales bacterium]
MTNQNSIFARVVKSALGLLGRTRLPRIDGHFRLAGLHAPVEIIRDSWGVPHIYAQNKLDLFFAQGFIHAQDRLWQMEFNRRLVAGRLAETLGAAALPLDRWMRTLTLRRVAEFEVSLLSAEVKSYLQAYANGVNIGALHGRLPIEFTLLGYRPEPWQISDSLAWIKMMSWNLSVNWESELLRAQLIARLGPELAAEMEAPHLSHWPYIAPPGTDYSYIGASALERAQQTRPFTGPSPYEGLGSNNWALSGERTISGKPILANDMHLGLTAPAIWYENHLICNELNITGVTFPGIPAVVSGHNGHVAWGFTNGFADVQDLYIERLQRTQNGEVQVEYLGKWEPARVIKETIRVKGEQPFVEEVIITRHGPIINSLAPDFAGEQPLALRWTSLEPDRMAESVFHLMSANDCQEFHQALQHWTAPVQNVVYADIHGNIGYTLAGKIPLRQCGNGRLPVPGWTDEYEWIGYIPFDALPHLYNPPQGYIVSANNRVVGDDYPLPLELEPISGDRAQRISEMILDSSLRNGEDRMDISFVQRMQFDLVSPSARLVARHLARLPLSQSAHTPSTDLHTVAALMKEWDGKLSSKSAPAAIYQTFIRKLAALLVSARLEDHNQNQQEHLSDAAPIRLTERFMGKGPTPILAETSLFGERWLPWLIHLLHNPESPFFDLGNGEKRDNILQMVLEQTLNEMKTFHGDDILQWRWGRIHQVTFRHSLSNDPILGKAFNIGPYPVGGDSSTIWATGTSYHSLDSDNMIGPPYRMIVDLADLDNSRSLLAPGQSGNLSSPHYRDQVKAWFNADYHPMLYSHEQVEKAKQHHLTLEPKLTGVNSEYNPYSA